MLPPRNISADPGHKWFDDYWLGRVDVLVDGEPRVLVRTASADEGWALCLVRPVRKGPDGDPLTEMVRGKVEIVARAKEAV